MIWLVLRGLVLLCAALDMILATWMLAKHDPNATFFMAQAAALYGLAAIRQ